MASVQPQAQAAKVTIQQQPDGRHAVLNDQGMVLGLHNSPVSAARQVSEYLGQHAGAHDATPIQQQQPIMSPGAVQMQNAQREAMAAMGQQAQNGIASQPGMRTPLPPAPAAPMQAQMQEQLANRLRAANGAAPQAPSMPQSSLMSYRGQ